MAEELNNQMKALGHEVTLLHFQWAYFIQLFGNAVHVATFNETAGGAFHAIENAMLHDLLMTIMRLCDPPISAGKKTLSFRGVAACTTVPEVKQQIEEIEWLIREKTEAVRIWRNQKLAHNDLQRHLSGEPLPEIQVNNLKDALRLIAKAMNVLNGHFHDLDVRYESSYIDPGDGNALWFYLQYGLECYREDRAKVDFTRSKKIRDMGSQNEST